MRKVFPLSFKGKSFLAVILSTLYYTLIVVAASVIAGVLPFSGILGIIINILRQTVLLYCVSGIVVAVLNACDLLDKKWFN